MSGGAKSKRGPLTQRAKAFDNMPASERAAALMHLVYFATIDRPDVDWSSALPKNWLDLDDRARRFNLAILETWAENPELLDQWVDAVKRLRTAQRGTKAPRRK